MHQHDHPRAPAGVHAIRDDRIYARAPDALPHIHYVTAPLLRAAGVRLERLRGAVLANPHHEPQVPQARRGHARDAAVLIAFQPDASGSFELLLTERQAGLRFAGHMAFPGGHRERRDAGAAETALRESEEEIGLARADVQVLAELPPYYSHAGHRIVGVLGLVAAAAPMAIDPREVARLVRVPAPAVFDPRAYRLHRRSAQPYRANYQWRAPDPGLAVVLGGPTLSLLIHVFDAAARAWAEVEAARA